MEKDFRRTPRRIHICYLREITMYKQFASGYLVHDGKILLVHHNKFNKWVPPGGHLEENETPDETVVREFREETALNVEVIPAYPSAFAGDSNATPIPMPFHIDLEREGFNAPRIGFFFFVKTLDNLRNIRHQTAELHSIGWFSESEIDSLKTFDQVKALAKFVLKHYPK